MLTVGVITVLKNLVLYPVWGLLRISNLLRLNILNYFTFQAALENRSYTDLHRLHLILRQAEIVTLSTKYF